MFNLYFWEKIKNTIKVFHLNFLFNTIGHSYLTKKELEFLENEIGKKNLNYNIVPLVDKIFILGQLAQKLGITNINEVNLNDFEDYISEGIKNKNIKTSNEKLDILKKQAYLDILGKQFGIEKDIRQSILNEENNNRGKFRISKIVESIKDKFENWSSLDNSISYISESAFDEGKAVQIKEESNLDDPYVYKVPIEDERLCKSCRSAYLNKDGSPRIFRLSELEANGSNIGLKPNEWKPTLGQLHLHCYDKETEVLTDEGWKFFKDLRGDEKCLTFDINSKNVEWSNILNKISYFYEGNMHLYEHGSFSLCVTPEHNQVVLKQIKENKVIKYKTVLQKDKDLPINNRFYKSIPNYIGENKEFLEICGYKFNTYNFCAFLGYYLSEGSINYNYSKDTCEIKISQNKDRFFEDILKYSRLCFNNVWGTGKQAIYIYINKELGQWFKNFGYSFEKYIPIEIKNLDKKYLEIFLEKYINGDGNRSNYNKNWKGYNFKGVITCIATSSYRMASDLSEIILKIGKSPRFFIQDNRNKVVKKADGSLIQSKHIIYKININDSLYSTCKRQIINYKDNVYCVEVEKNHTLFVKRHGNITISGNCRCILQYVNILKGTTLNDYIWSEKSQRYILNEESTKDKKVERKSKVKITVGKKIFEV